MFITIDELYEMKDKYSREILELEMKKDVVDDLIKYAEAKQVSHEEVELEEVETECEPVVEAEL